MKLALLFLLCLTCQIAQAQTSHYTKLDLDKDCVFTQSNDQGGSAICTGYKKYPVYFSEGDLRQQVQFGFIDTSINQWESFGQFNSINDTIEWRLENGVPYATILRWFISNIDEQSGIPTKQSRGQVLVISTVAATKHATSCIAGYVDARANNNANIIARQVADEIAIDFTCGKNLPEFHGKRGKYSGNPTALKD